MSTRTIREAVYEYECDRCKAVLVSSHSPPGWAQLQLNGQPLNLFMANNPHRFKAPFIADDYRSGHICAKCVDTLLTDWMGFKA